MCPEVQAHPSLRGLCRFVQTCAILDILTTGKCCSQRSSGALSIFRRAGKCNQRIDSASSVGLSRASTTDWLSVISWLVVLSTVYSSSDFASVECPRLTTMGSFMNCVSPARLTLDSGHPDMYPIQWTLDCASREYIHFIKNWAKVLNFAWPFLFFIYFQQLPVLGSITNV